MPNVVVLYCGSTLTKNLYDELLGLHTSPCLLPSNTPLNVIQALDPLAIIITGSPDYVNSPRAPQVNPGIYTCDIPVLGICYGMQIMVVDLGGEVKRTSVPELRSTHMDFTDNPSVLFRDFTEEGMSVWMLHVCKVTQLPPGFSVTGFTKRTEHAAIEDEERKLYAVQFHPEHKGKDPSSQAGSAVIWNFLNGVCGHVIPTQ